MVLPAAGSLSIHRRLSFRVLLPIVGFVLLLGAAALGYSLYTLSRFADQQLESSLRLHANTVRQIVDDHRELPRLAGAEQAARNRRIEALLTIEDFARANDLLIQVDDRTNQRRMVLGDLGVELPLAGHDPAAGPRTLVAGERRFQTHAVSFAPWDWEILLVGGDTAAYTALKAELLRGAWVAAALLAGATLFFLVYLVSLTQAPTRAIIDDLKAGRPPRYRGIAEFEFLGESIAGMMRELNEKSVALERYREHLEQLVAERTAELTLANERLQAANRELENSHQQLLQSEKLAAIGQLAAGVAHEINNPLGYVNSNLGVLGQYIRGLFSVIAAYEHQLDGAESAEVAAVKRDVDYAYLKTDFAQLFEESVSGLARVKKIVVDLRDFSRAGDREWAKANLNQGLDSTLNIVANELKYKAKVIKDYGELPEIECLPGELNQVFLNLLVNAGHALREQGEITVRTRAGDGEVVVEIADNGCGIPPEILPRIFDPFFTTKPVGLGTGLGLAVSYGIVQKHHGHIEVDSTVNRGTTFRLHLPSVRPGKAAVADALLADA